MAQKMLSKLVMRRILDFTDDFATWVSLRETSKSWMQAVDTHPQCLRLYLANAAYVKYWIDPQNEATTAERALVILQSPNSNFETTEPWQLIQRALMHRDAAIWRSTMAMEKVDTNRLIQEAIRQCNLCFLRVLLKSCSHLINCTQLHMVLANYSEHGSRKVIDLFLQHGCFQAHRNCIDGMYAMNSPPTAKHSIPALLCSMDFYDKTIVDWGYLIAKAIRTGDSQFIVAILKQPNIDLNGLDGFFLRHCVEHRNATELQALLQSRSTDVSVRGNWCLRLAAERKDVDLAIALLNHPSFSLNRCRNQSLLSLIKWGNVSVLHRALKHPTYRPNRDQCKQQNLLTQAVIGNRPRMVELLINAGEDPSRCSLTTEGILVYGTCIDALKILVNNAELELSDEARYWLHQSEPKKKKQRRHC